ncbi:NUDIX domain-containing protein [Lacticaseibacillus saniviri]
MTKAYTLIVVETASGFLLINRAKPPYRGMWNALGGKIEADESQMMGANRELMEESGLTDVALHDRGLIHWYVDGSLRGDLYLFTGQTDWSLPQPKQTREGILATVSRDWLLMDNLGVVPDLSAVLPTLLAGERHTYRSDFRGEHFERLVIEDD